MIMQMEVVKIYRVNFEDGKIKGYADIVIGDYVIKSFKIIDGKNGLFVQVPTKTTKDGRQYNIFMPRTREARRVLEALIIGAFNT